MTKTVGALVLACAALLTLAAPAGAQKASKYQVSFCPGDVDFGPSCAFGTPCTVLQNQCVFETTLPNGERVPCSCLEVGQVSNIIGASFSMKLPRWKLSYPKISGSYPGDGSWTVTGSFSYEAALLRSYEAECAFVGNQVQSCEAPLPGSIDDYAGVTASSTWLGQFTIQEAVPLAGIRESGLFQLSNNPAAPNLMHLRQRNVVPFQEQPNVPFLAGDAFVRRAAWVSPTLPDLPLPDPPSLPTAYSFVIELSFATSEDKARLKQGLGRLTETFVNQDSSAQIMRLDDYGNPVCIPKDPACASCVFCSDPMDYECQDQASQCGPLLTAVDALVDDKVVRFVYKDMPPRALAPPLEQYVLCANHYPAPGSTYVNECHTATYQDGGL